MKINKDLIMRELWERDYLRKLQRDMIENAVGAYRAEYIGEFVETDTIKKAEIQIRNNVFHAMVKMLTAYMMSYVFERCIEEIVDIIELKEQPNEDSR